MVVLVGDDPIERRPLLGQGAFRQLAHHLAPVRQVRVLAQPRRHLFFTASVQGLSFWKRSPMLVVNLEELLNGWLNVFNTNTPLIHILILIHSPFEGALKGLRRRGIDTP